MSKSIYINLPVKDLAASTRFYAAIGCTKNEQFSDETTSSSMVWSDTVTFQIQTHEHFASFTPKPIADAHQTCQVLLALPCDTREEVDAIVAAAGANGGIADVREAHDMGWLYNRAFSDPDGHTLEVLWLDSSGMPDGE